MSMCRVRSGRLSTKKRAKENSWGNSTELDCPTKVAKAEPTTSEEPVNGEELPTEELPKHADLIGIVTPDERCSLCGADLQSAVGVEIHLATCTRLAHRLRQEGELPEPRSEAGLARGPGAKQFAPQPQPQPLPPAPPAPPPALPPLLDVSMSLQSNARRLVQARLGRAMTQPETETLDAALVEALGVLRVATDEDHRAALQLVALTSLSTPAGAHLWACLLDEAERTFQSVAAYAAAVVSAASAVASAQFAAALGL